jgi:hypothetical protein
MKHLINISIIACVIHLSSCSKSSKIAESIAPRKVRTSSGSELYSSLSQLTTTDAIKTAFQTLTPAEKSALWRYKVDLFMSTNNFTTSQNSYLLAVKDILSPGAYTEGSNEQAVAATTVLPAWIAQAKNLFTPVQIANLMGRLVPLSESELLVVSNTSLPASLPIGGQMSLCGCAIGSRYTCGRVTTIEVSNSSMGVGMEWGACSGPTCVKTGSGCGGFFIWACDGANCTYGATTTTSAMVPFN